MKLNNIIILLTIISFGACGSKRKLDKDKKREGFHSSDLLPGTLYSCTNGNGCTQNAAVSKEIVAMLKKSCQNQKGNWQQAACASSFLDSTVYSKCEVKNPNIEFTQFMKEGGKQECQHHVDGQSDVKFNGEQLEVVLLTEPYYCQGQFGENSCMEYVKYTDIAFTFAEAGCEGDGLTWSKGKCPSKFHEFNLCEFQGKDKHTNEYREGMASFECQPFEDENGETNDEEKYKYTKNEEGDPSGFDFPLHK